MKKYRKYYLRKLNRISGWCLMVFIPILFITGYGISGDYQWTAIIATADLHSHIHMFFMPFTIGTFIIHALVNIYFTLKRWHKK
ncbi:MAG: hypothetical protein HQK83_01430 [Fibrobacteria bacterium]|nr:hypothetical protein [Fibrobacteria bacterium]